MAWSPGPGATPNNDYFLGGSGNDFADGQAGDDILNGLDGNDTLSGNTGADTLFGATGNDSLSGGDGNDYIFDTDGNDTISGGAGDDTITVDDRYAGFGDIDRIDGGSGADLIQVSTPQGGGTLTGGADFDTLEFYVNQSDYTVDLSKYSISTIERLNANMALYGHISDFTQFTYLRLSADDINLASQMSITLQDSGSINLLSQLGTQSAYIATYSSGNNYVQAGAGNDNLVGGSGNDTLDASVGNDNIDGGYGDDLLYGFIGDDSLYGSYGDDESDVGTGNDLIVDIDGNDTLNGDDGNDAIYNLNFTGADTYSDNIDGGDGDDQVFIAGIVAGTVLGGNGNDVLTINQASGTDFSFSAVTVGGFETLMTHGANLTGSIAAFASFGAIRISSDHIDLFTPIQLTLTDGGLVDLSGALGPQCAAIIAGHDPIQLTTGSGECTVTGSVGDDIVTGGASTDTVYGGTGRDILYGGAGHDHLVGDDAFDRFVFVADSDMIYGGDGGDLIEGNGGGDYLYGGDGNDAIYGDYQNQTHVDDDLSGGDYIEGGAGNDTLMGQAGNDTIHGGDGNDKIYGNDDNRNTGGDNQLYGEDGDDYIQDDELYDWDLRVYIAGTTYMDGGLGADTIVCATTYGTIIGGANPDGNVLGDVLRVSTRTLVGLTITGIETLDALGTVTATLAQFEAFDHIINTATEPVYEEHIPTLKLADAGAIDLSDELGTQKVKITASSGGNSIKTGSGADILIGGAGDDTLMGGAGDDSFSGGAGADTMVGGAGNDTFVVDNAGDVVTEVGGQGTDVIQASISYALSASVEVLTLTGSANIDGTGNSGKNTLNGNAGNNNLNGGAGADTMAGGLGDDTYYVNDAGDRVIESDGGGTDTVFAGLTYSGAGQYIENITLLGSGDISALGNGLDNTLRGNAGNNSLNGSGGADTMIGGAGNDSYSVDDAGDVVVETGSPGVDVVNSRVTFDIGTQYIEVVNLTSSGNVNAYGSTTSRAETLNGNTGANLLDGRNGADTMAGGAGNDTYVVDNPGDVVTENASEGTDTVRSFLSYILTANVENLELQGASNINGTGNGLANILTGNGGNNRLDGGTGADTLIGGLGDDSYYVDNAGDVTVEANGQGMDTVFARVSYVLGATAYIDVLTLAGAGNINGTGNGAANALNGNGGNNSLDGASGNDTLTGGAGNDTLTGGNGADAFVFGLGSGQDVVNDFKSSQNDTLNIHAYSNGVVNGGGVTMTAQGSNTLINLGGGNTILVLNIIPTDSNFLNHIVW